MAYLTLNRESSKATSRYRCRQWAALIYEPRSLLINRPHGRTAPVHNSRESRSCCKSYLWAMYNAAAASPHGGLICDRVVDLLGGPQHFETKIWKLQVILRMPGLCLVWEYLSEYLEHYWFFPQSPFSSLHFTLVFLASVPWLSSRGSSRGIPPAYCWLGWAQVRLAFWPPLPTGPPNGLWLFQSITYQEEKQGWMLVPTLPLPLQGPGQGVSATHASLSSSFSGSPIDLRSL